MLVDIYLLIYVTSRRVSKNWGQGNGLDDFAIVAWFVVGWRCRDAWNSARIME